MRNPILISLIAVAVVAPAQAQIATGVFSGTTATSKRLVQFNVRAAAKLIVDSGWYLNESNGAGVSHDLANLNYFAGASERGEYRNFFVIDLTKIPRNQPIRSFSLLLDQPFGRVGLPVTYTLYDVSTPIDVLRLGTGAPFDDLGSGVSYGSFTTPAIDQTLVRLDLNAAGIAAATAARRGMFAIGGRVTVGTLGPAPVMPLVSAVPEPAAWAMMIAGFGIVGGAARRRRPLTS